MRVRTKQKKSRGNRIGAVILLAALGVFVIFSVVNIVKLFAFDLQKSRQTVQQLQQEVDRQQVEVDELKRALEKGLTRADVEQIARDKLGLSSKDEQVYYNVDS